MNVIEMHGRVDFWADKVKSPRYRKDDVNTALAIAIDYFVKDRYDNIKRQVGYSFELLERVREELYTLIAEYQSTFTSNNLFLLPANYLYYLLLKVTLVNNKVYTSDYKDYNEDDLEQNSFTKADHGYIYHRRTSGALQMTFGPNIPNSGYLYYLRKPGVCFWNKESITPLQLLNIGLVYYVASQSVVHNGVVYNQGDIFIATALTFAGPGVLNLISNCDLPESTHEEVAKIAAMVITGTFEDYQKSGKMFEEQQKV